MFFMSIYNYFLIYFYMMGVFVFFSMRKHLLLTLLSLEYLVLILFMFFFNFVFLYSFEYYILFLFLTFSVCEGVLGLGILVSLIRCHGNDNLMIFSMLKW